jgi:hypothetical protein
VTDLGTDNGTAAALQAYFRDNPEAHRYVPSPRNQRIEGWWAYYARSHSQWWRNFFKDLGTQGIVDTSCELNMECLWYCFHKLLQTELESIKEHWNSHRICKSKYDTVSGQPDSLYSLPQLQGWRDYLVQIQAAEIEFATEQIIEHEMGNDYQEYFEYARSNMSLSYPADWEEALNIFRTLMDVATNGYD